MGADLKSIAQPSGVSHIAIGDIVVSVVNDGVHQSSYDDLVTSDRAACERCSGPARHHGHAFRRAELQHGRDLLG